MTFWEIQVTRKFIVKRNLAESRWALFGAHKLIEYSILVSGKFKLWKWLCVVYTGKYSKSCPTVTLSATSPWLEIVYQKWPWKSWGPIFRHSVKLKPHNEPCPLSIKLREGKFQEHWIWFYDVIFISPGTIKTCRYKFEVYEHYQSWRQNPLKWIKSSVFPATALICSRSYCVGLARGVLCCE